MELAGMNGWKRWLPGLQIISRYEAAWLPRDVMAGLVLTTMLVPVGIAYAVASGVPGIYGLYATIVPLLAYALFGPSRILVLGPDSALAPVILAVVLPLSAGDPPAQALRSHPGDSDRSRRRYRRSRRARPRPERRAEVARSAAAGSAVVRAAVGEPRRPARRGDRRLCRRDGGVRRHQRPVAHVCRENAFPGRSEPGDGRSGRRQPGRRTVPG